MGALYYAFLETYALMPHKAVKSLRDIEREFEYFPKYANLTLMTEEYIAQQHKANDSAQNLIAKLEGAVDVLDAQTCYLEEAYINEH